MCVRGLILRGMAAVVTAAVTTVAAWADWTITVNSSNPSSGASIEYGASSGVGTVTTPGSIQAADGSNVTLIAPTEWSSTHFVAWVVDGVQQPVGNVTLSFTATKNSTATAVFGTPLCVGSQNPSFGVPITVDTADLSGNGSGITGFTRCYVSGTTVGLTAPATQGGLHFQYWTLGALTKPTGQTSLSVPLGDYEQTATAVYAVQYTLTVQSQDPNSGVAITCWPNDFNGNGNGTTAFTRTYFGDTQVTLTAALTAAGNPFQYWLVDGAPQPTGVFSLTVTMGSDHTITAVYGTGTHTLNVQSLNPSSGVAVTVTPNDVNGNGDGTTTFTRTYNAGTAATLTASSTAGTQAFQYWEVDGVPQTGGQTALTVPMGADHTAVAVYAQYTLTVQSSFQAPTVAMTVTPNDVAGNGNGITAFTRGYDAGASVTLTAPLTAGTHGETFSDWMLDGKRGTPHQTTITVPTDGNHTAVAEYGEEIQVTVQSQNPNSGVAVTATGDMNGNGNGITPFNRFYFYGGFPSFTAPAQQGGNYLLYWMVDGAPGAAGQTTVEIGMLTQSTTIAAVYGPRYTLTVQSQSPDSGVAVTATPSDLNGNGSGTTAFALTYNTGTTVILEAPLAAGGIAFRYWTLDGTPQAAGQNDIAVGMGANHTVVAIYGTQRTLTVQSQNPNAGVAISVTPNDVNGNGNGSTAFTRTYNLGASATLTAPPTAGGNGFQYWTLDGTPQANGQTSITVAVGANHTVVAVYGTQCTLTVQSQNPASGVGIGVTPTDANGNGNGNTAFSRTYNLGTSVTLTAPATAGGNPLQYWTLDGTPQAAGQTTLTVPMGVNHTAVAVYSVQYTLTVQSQSPNSGVSVTVSPLDVNLTGDGTTAFTRVYNQGATVKLMAPTNAGMSGLLYWTVDGVPQPKFQNGVTIPMNGNHTAVAVYWTGPITVTVESQNPGSGVTVSCSPTDVDGKTAGTTTFTLSYNTGVGGMTLGAPPTAGGNIFQYWMVDGVPYPNGTTYISVVGFWMDHTCVAVYSATSGYTLTVQSQSPDSGVSITAAPNDALGNGGGNTTFTLAYASGTSVTLTAPASAEGNTFQYWSLDGTAQTNGQTSLTVAMGANHTAVAVYGNVAPFDTGGHFSIHIDDLTAYGSAWRHGATWPKGPNPILQSYVTVAAAIWLSGEAYTYDSTKQAPYCWVPAHHTPVAAGLQGAPAAGKAVRAIAKVEGMSDTWRVTVTVQAPPGTKAYSVEDIVPIGAKVSGVSDRGCYNPATRSIRWGPFLDGRPRTLSYLVKVVRPMQGLFTGTAFFDGSGVAVTGARDVPLM